MQGGAHALSPRSPYSLHVPRDPGWRLTPGGSHLPFSASDCARRCWACIPELGGGGEALQSEGGGRRQGCVGSQWEKEAGRTGQPDRQTEEGQGKADG